MSKGSAAAKRAALRAQPEEDPEFQIAPMIDILLVLLVFFMSISSTEVLQTNDFVKLPVAKDAKDKEKKSSQQAQTIVNVLSINGAHSIDIDSQKFVAAADITPLLLKRYGLEPAMRVLVRADKEVRYQYMREIIMAIGQAKITNVTFSVVDKDAPAAGAPPG